MKKNLLFISLLMTAFCVGGRTLTPQEALERLNNDNGAMKIVSSSAALSAPRLVHTSVTSAGVPAVYLFERAGADGYMLVSADDVATPLLGYSDAPVREGAEMPVSMQWWLEQYAAEIEHASGNVSLRSVDPSKAAGETSTFAPIAPLCKTRWDQDAPYNNMCPMYNGRRTYTGCLATALAQIMKYHEWPAHGQGSNTYTDNKGTIRTMNFDVDFDWGNMLDSYDNSATAAQNDAVALLMKACGYGVNMTYGVDASSATDIYVISALSTYFGYDADAVRRGRDYYGLADWQKMIYDNLRDVGPVLYCGASHLGGHAFVCDGYSTDGYFHFNWGWSGAYDGYFLLTALNPEGEGIGGYAGGYNLYQCVILGIQKPDGKDLSEPNQLSQKEALTGSLRYGNLTLTSTWGNDNSEDMAFSIALRLEPCDGTTGEPTYIESNNYRGLTLSSGYGWQKQSLMFDVSGVANGMYKASIVTRNDDSEDEAWLPTLHPLTMPDYVLLNKKQTGSTVSDVAAGHLTVQSAESLTPLYENCLAKLTMSVTNNSEMEVAQVLSPALVSGNSLVALGEGVFFDLMPGESSTRELVFNFAVTSSFRLNTNYQLCLLDPVAYMIYYQMGTVKVLSYPGDPELSASAFALAGGTSEADCRNLHFSASVTCLSGYMATPLMVSITPKGGDSVLATGYTSESIFLPAGEATEAVIDMAFPAGEVGKTYTAALKYLKGDNAIQLRSLDFTVGSAGVEIVEKGDNDITVAYDRASRRVSVMSPTPVSHIQTVTAAGVECGAPVEINGKSAIVDFSGFTSGIVILTVTSEDGEIRTAKIAL